VASGDAWAKSGLTPPVGLESLTVSIEPGFVKDSRTLVLRSNQPVDKPIIDVLLALSSASGTAQIQSSFLVLTRESSGTNMGAVLVRVGDTLSAIALANPVAGADLYQMLWALYQANPQAFMSQNMNLLKAGVTLNLPDTQTVLAIDQKIARDMYQAHLNAFKTLRGGSTAAGSVASRAAAVTAPLPGDAQTSSVSAAAVTSAPTSDRVLLTSASSTEQREDARVATAKEIAEIQSRVDSLQQNVQQLKDALNQAQNGALGSSTTTALTPRLEDSTGSARAVSGASAAAGAHSTVIGALGQLWSSLTSSVLGIITAILAIGGLLVAWLLRRAGARREVDEAEGHDVEQVLDPLTRTTLDQKLQGVDLNLDQTTLTEKKEPSMAQPPAGPTA
jgi:pilus assembly protein FimV